MSNKLYWVWAQNALGISASVKSDEIVSYFGNAEKLYYAGEYEWKISGIFTNGQINKLKSTSLDSAEKIVAECEKYKIKIVTPDDGDYPSMLFKLPNLPLVLYVRGDLDCLKNKIAVAMVGAREASDIGVRIARSLSASLSRSGDITSSMNMGTNKLLRDGAKPVFNAMDVLEEYAERYPDMLDIDKIESILTIEPETVRTEKRKKEEKAEKQAAKNFVKSAAPNNISEKARMIFDAFSEETMQAEELILRTKLSTVDFLSAMTELEILGYIEPLAGKNYKLK